MFKTRDEALTFIENQRINNTSLDEFRKVFKKYDDFHKRLRVIHTTGTNGKGSTSKMIHDILLYNHYKVGLFTSPHMLVANDRIRINNQYISDEDLLLYVNDLYDDILEYELNFFQIYTLIALKYFYDNDVDLIIMEVGIGGLLDSTNVINGLVSVITNINYDHTDKLGKSLSDIAYQKAGIIKNGSHVVTAVQQESALNVIEEKVLLTKSKLYKIEERTSRIDSGYRVFNCDGESYVLNSLAKYQVNNALIALKVIDILSEFYDYPVDVGNVKKALKDFMWFGRFEKVSDHPEIIIDGAHNIAGIKALINNDEEDSVVIFSALKDKDYYEMIALLSERYDELVFVEFDFYRSLKINDLLDFDFAKFSALDDAIEYLREKYNNRRIIICGSLYFISEVREYFKGDFNDSNN